MSWFGSTLAPGDWVVAHHDIPATAVETITGLRGVIRKGTAGVVTAEPKHGLLRSRIEVRFNTDLIGVCTVTVPLGAVRITRRDGGVDALIRRRNLLGSARVGIAAVLLAPTLWFVLTYVWENRSTDGLGEVLAWGTVTGFFDTVEYAITNPTRALVYFLCVWGMWRFTFRR